MFHPNITTIKIIAFEILFLYQTDRNRKTKMSNCFLLLLLLLDSINTYHLPAKKYVPFNIVFRVFDDYYYQDQVFIIIIRIGLNVQKKKKNIKIYKNRKTNNLLIN